MVGHRDRPQPLLAGCRQQHLHRGGAVVGVVGVHVQVHVDRRPAGQAAAELGVSARVAPARGQLPVEPLQLVRHVAPRALWPARRHEPVVGREVALHQLRRRREARGARVEPSEERRHEAASQERGEQPLGGRVEGAHVERARVAQRSVRGARCERLVHVHEVELDRAQQLLDRARHVDRQRPCRPARAGGDVEHLPHRDYPRLTAVGPLQQALRMLARRPQCAPRRAHPFLRARGGEDQHAVPAPREFARHAGARTR